MPYSSGLPIMRKTYLNENVFSVEEIRRFFLYETNPTRKGLRRNRIECFKILNSFTNVGPTKLFVMDDSSRTRNNGAKLKCRQVHSDCTDFFFTNAVVRDWNRLPPSVIGSLRDWSGHPSEAQAI